jgi:hypothetical protein
LDWCSENDLKNTIIFNDNSIISNKNINNSIEVKNVVVLTNSKIELKIDDCFNINLDVSNSKELLNVLSYLSTVSNHLRTQIRNKSIKSFDLNIKNNNDENIIKVFNEKDFLQLVNYLIWIKDASIKVKKFFLVSNRKDNSSDPHNIKPFKTSSYKFCNLKELCTIHKNKNKICEKNHFVFDMIINDINKLIDSVNLVGENNFNWILNNKTILINYSEDTKEFIITKIIKEINKQIEITDDQFIIDKTLIFKSFDVISYVLNKMYEEAYTFINNNMHTNQIII